MPGNGEDSVDLWRRVASAVEYIGAVESAGFTIWDGVADAIASWTDDGSVDGADMCECPGEVDRLRYLIGVLFSRLPPAGAPGGVAVEAALEAALSNWLERVEADLNGGCRFAARAATHIDL